MLTGCDLGTDPPLPPPVRIVATVPSAPDGGLGTHPIGLPLRASFDRLLAPSTVHTGSVLVRSGAVGVFGGVRYDPVRREVRFTPDPRAFRSALQYEFEVTRTVRAWDGGPLAVPITVRFVPAPMVPVSSVPAPSLARDVAPLLAARCGSVDCHGGPDPVLGLDLSSAAAIRRTALGVPARQRPARARGEVFTAMDPAWGVLARVDPGFVAGQGRPEYSYLVYKLLGDGPIVGLRMPPEGPALSFDEIARVSDWIAAGAPE